MKQLLPRRIRQIQLSWLITYADPITFVACCPSLVILVSLVCCMAFARGRWRLIEWLYVIAFVKVFTTGLSPVFTGHKPACCDIILVTLVCFWGPDWWRWPIEPLYVIIRSSSLIPVLKAKLVAAIFYRVRRNPRPQMRQTHHPSVTSADSNQTACFKSF